MEYKSKTNMKGERINVDRNCIDQTMHHEGMYQVLIH